MTRLARRDFLKTTLAGTAGLWLAQPVFAAGEDPYAGFKMGIQSYSLRGFDENGALERTQTLGLNYWESFPGHIPLSTVPKHIAEQKQILQDAGVTLMSYGVVPFNANESKSREMFEFAQGMGLKALSADPEKNKETFDLLDKLVEEYGVAIAIHNHGPGARYDKIKDVWEQVKDRHPKVGACVDTGHYLRSDEDPVAAIEQFGKRVFSVHLKDVKTIQNGGKREKKFTIIGEGDLDILGCLKALKKLKYESILAIEYEENPENPLSDLEVGLKNVRAAAAKLA
jgi:sugar phosphate isomerase/epimerase